MVQAPLQPPSHVGHPQGTAARVNVRATVEEQLAHGQVARLRQETLAPSPVALTLAQGVHLTALHWIYL